MTELVLSRACDTGLHAAEVGQPDDYDNTRCLWCACSCHCAGLGCGCHDRRLYVASALGGAA